MQRMKRAPRGEAKRKLLEMLTASGKRMSGMQVRAAMKGVPPSVIYRSLFELVKEGRVIREGTPKRAIYQLKYAGSEPYKPIEPYKPSGSIEAALSIGRTMKPKLRRIEKRVLRSPIDDDQWLAAYVQGLTDACAS
jgi:hypothetical protein